MMVAFDRGCITGVGLLALLLAGPALAQENLDEGKTPAQLYAADCAICHKSPNGMTKNVGVFGLVDFLREHYTASRQSAAAIAAYVESIDKGPSLSADRSARKKTAKDSKHKPEQAEAVKTGETKPAEPKPSDAKSTETKSSEAKSSEATSSTIKSDDAKRAKDDQSDNKAN
jgi:hypothetical protein